MVKVGTIFIVSSGAYEDFQILKAFYTERDFSFDEVMNEWYRTHPPDSDSEFLASLEAEGFVSSVRLPQLHISEYGRPFPTPEKTEEAQQGYVTSTIDRHLPLKQWLPVCLEHEDCASDSRSALGVICAKYE